MVEVNHIVFCAKFAEFIVAITNYISFYCDTISLLYLYSSEIEHEKNTHSI